MTSLDAGSARARYDLDISGLRRSVAEAKQLYRSLKQEAVQAAAPARSSGASSPERARALQIAAIERALRQQAAAERAAVRDQQRLTDSTVRAARAEGDYARALQIVERELARTAQGTTRYNDLLARQASLRRQTEGTRPPTGGGGGGALGGVGQVAGALGIGFGAAQLVQGGVAAGQEALALRETKNALQAVAGDWRTYANVVRVAREQQVLFGGSLRQNLEDLSGLTITSRSTGASLESLIDLSQRLSVLSPEQGIQGARIAIAEAFGEGNITSLSRRFEIPKQQLEALRDTSTSAADKVAILDAYLNKVGVTSDAVKGKVDADAVAFRQLNQELSDLGTQSGDALASGFSQAAVGLGRLVGVINQNPQAIAELKALFSGRYLTDTDVAQQRMETAQGRASEVLGGRRGETVVATRLGGREELEAVRAQIARIASQGEGAEDAVNKITRAWLRSADGADVLRSGLNRLEAELNRSTSAVGQQEEANQKAVKAQQDANDALLETIKNQQANAVQAQALAAINHDLEAATIRVALGQSNQAIEAAKLEARYPALAGEAYALITAQLGLEAAALAAANALREQQLAGQQAQTRDLTGGRGVAVDAPGRRGSDVADFERFIAEQQALKAAQQRQTEALESTAQRVARLRKAEAEALATSGRDSAAYVDAQTARIQAEQQLATEQERAASKGARALTSRTRATDTALSTIENRTEDHYRKLAQIQEDYQTRARRSQEDFELGRARSQDDFERQRRRLLAEGKIFEARQLTEEFTREQARQQQDFARDQARESEDTATRIRREGADLGIDTQRTRERAAIRGVRLPDATAGAPAIGPLPTTALPTAGASRDAGIAPQVVQVLLNGRVVLSEREIGEIVIDTVDQSLAAGLIQLQISSPPRIGPTTAIGGPRP